jgi:SAM-dependent methyltransferase
MAPPDPAPAREVVRYGPDIPDEDDLRLLGSMADKRVLVLGLHDPSATIALAQQGAKVIAVDPDATKLERGRAAVEAAEARAEFREADLAGLAFLPGDSFDLVLSINTLAGVDDLNRVFRQVHRVLKADMALVVALPHPAYAMLDQGRPPSQADDPVIVARPYGGGRGDDGFDERTGLPTAWRTYAPSDAFTAMHRAKFRLDGLLEPPANTSGPRSPRWNELMAWAPPTLILRARKEGI